MTSSCTTTTTTGDQPENRPEIPGDDVITGTADEKVFPAPENDVTESTKPKIAGESPTDLSPAAGSTSSEAQTADKDAELCPTTSKSPRQICRDANWFRGHENYGFEWVTWSKEQHRLQNQNSDEST